MTDFDDLDELDARIRSLEAERLRPVPPPYRTTVDLARKILADLQARDTETDRCPLDDPP